MSFGQMSVNQINQISSCESVLHYHYQLLKIAFLPRDEVWVPKLFTYNSIKENVRPFYTNYAQVRFYVLEAHGRLRSLLQATTRTNQFLHGRSGLKL